MKRLAVILGLTALLWGGCAGGSSTNPQESTQQEQQTTTATEEATTETTTEQRSESKGVGPIKEVNLPEEIDQTLAAKGEEIFKSKCSACHKIDKRLVGPPLKGILQRRTPEWVMNMILNPQEMLEKDPVAKQLLQEYLTPMTFQNVTEEDARAILEYLRQF